MANKHFFKPLLPGFHSHLEIPLAFFSKYIEGRNEQKTTAKLRSDASKLTWKVKIEDGRRITDGWKEFALAHDLRIGDIVIFRQEKDMSFHVTIFGPSFCEIQYEPCLDNENNLGKIPKKKKVKKNPRKVTESSSLDPSCFVSNVLPSTLRYDALYLPSSFVRANGLETRCGEIVLMNEKGTSWTLALKQRQCGKRTYIRRGWRSFCSANGLKARDFFTFKLIQGGGTLVLRLSTIESEEKEDCLEDDDVESISTEAESDEERNLESEGGEESSEGDETESLSTEPESDDESNQVEKSFKKPRSSWKASSSPSENRFVTLTLSPWDFKNSRMYLPMPFTRMNGINEKTKMTLLDKNGVKWSTVLRSEYKGERIRMVGGWRESFKASCVKVGESVMFKLIWEGETSCVLKFCSNVKQETK